MVEIESWNYRAKGKAWIDAALLRRFQDDLRHCYETLDGMARLTNNPEQQNLTVEVAFERRNGSVTIRGSYRETISEENELRFRIQSDQSYVRRHWPAWTRQGRRPAVGAFLYAKMYSAQEDFG